MNRVLAASLSVLATIGSGTVVPLLSGSASAAEPSQGTVVADSGFRPDTNGYSFENYGNEGGVTNLTPAAMQAIYGPAVCANDVSGNCTLVPPAQQQMDSWNAGMSGGHCYGMSITALAFSKGQLQATDYGSANVPGLKLADNQALQVRIAQSFVAQDFPSVRAKKISGTPNTVLDALIKNLNASKEGGTESWSLGFYKTDPKTGAPSGGHEVTPYQVVDEGNGQFGVLVYDNNFPGAVRTIKFNRNEDTWSYSASTNPKESESLYQGNAQTKTLELEPVTPGLGQQPWEDGQTLGGVKQAASVSGTTQTISLDSPNGDHHPHLLVTDSAGHQAGFVWQGSGFRFVNPSNLSVEWPKENRDWAEAEEPDYTVPTDGPVTIAIQGQGLPAKEDAEITVIGPGYSAAVTVTVAPGQVDRMTITPPSGGTAPTVTYRPGRNEAVSMYLDGDFSPLDWETTSAGTLSKSGYTSFQLGPSQLVVDNRAGATTTLQVTTTAIEEAVDHSPVTSEVPVPRQVTAIPLVPGPSQSP